MTELKNLVASFNNRLDKQKKKISELEEKSTEVIPSEKQTKKNEKQGRQPM